MRDSMVVQRELDYKEFSPLLKFITTEYSRFPGCEKLLKYLETFYVKQKQI